LAQAFLAQESHPDAVLPPGFACRSPSARCARAADKLMVKSDAKGETIASSDDDDARAFGQVRSLQGEKVSCCGLFKHKPKAFEQMIAIVRHSERQDHVDPTYLESEEGKAWPHDTPLTKKGFALARSVGLEILEIHRASPFSIVACSPYRRCLETASEFCKLLDLPVLIDQELGEVFDRHMPKDLPTHRTPLQLTELAEGLGMTVKNPKLPDGGTKLFGKPPCWPEDLESGSKRLICRIVTYIEQSEATKQNFLLVSHAPAVSGVLHTFERGNVDIRKMDYCARVVARRMVRNSHSGPTQHGVYARQWTVEHKGFDATTVKPEANMKDYYESMHIEFCEENEVMVANRREKRTATDKKFDQALRELAHETGAEALTKTAATLATLDSQPNGWVRDVPVGTCEAKASSPMRERSRRQTAATRTST